MYGMNNDVTCCPVDNRATRNLVDLLKEQEAILQDLMSDVACIHDCVVGTPLEGSVNSADNRTIVADVAETNAKLIALTRAIKDIKLMIGIG